jgi:hypothetical protein
MAIYRMQTAALQSLYTLWYAAGVSLGLLPPPPGWQKGIVPHFASDLLVDTTTAIKDGRLGYTDGVLTWQVAGISSHDKIASVLVRAFFGN